MDDLYSDLPEDTTSTYIAKLEDEIGDLKIRIQELETAIIVHDKNAEDLQKRLDNLQQENNTLRTNVSSLFYTAKAEIDRKNKQIDEYRQQSLERSKCKQYRVSRLEDVRTSEKSEERSFLTERKSNQMVSDKVAHRRIYCDDKSVQTSRRERNEKDPHTTRTSEKNVENEFAIRAKYPTDKLPSIVVAREELKINRSYSSREEEKQFPDCKKRRTNKWPDGFECEDSGRKNSSTPKNSVSNEEFAYHKRPRREKLLDPTDRKESSIRKNRITVHSEIRVKLPSEVKFENNENTSVKEETMFQKVETEIHFGKLKKFSKYYRTEKSVKDFKEENHEISKKRIEKREHSNVKPSDDVSGIVNHTSSFEETRKNVSELTNIKSAAVSPSISHFKKRVIAESEESIITDSKPSISSSSDRLDHQGITEEQFTSLKTIKSEGKAIIVNTIPDRNNQSIVLVDVEAKTSEKVENVKEPITANAIPGENDLSTVPVDVVTKMSEEVKNVKEPITANAILGKDDPSTVPVDVEAKVLEGVTVNAIPGKNDQSIVPIDVEAKVLEGVTVNVIHGRNDQSIVPVDAEAKILVEVKNVKEPITGSAIPGGNDQSIVCADVEDKTLKLVKNVKEPLTLNLKSAKNEKGTRVSNFNSVENTRMKTSELDDKSNEREKIELSEISAMNRILCTPMKLVNEELTTLSSFSNLISPLSETPDHVKEKLRWSANLKISPVPLLNEDRKDSELNHDSVITITGVDDVEHGIFRRKRKRIT